MTETINVNLQDLTSKMDQLKQIEAQLKFDLKNAEKEIEKIELQFATVLEQMNVDSMDYGVYTIGWKTTVSKRFNQKAFGQMYPDLLEKFKLPSENKKLEFKIND